MAIREGEVPRALRAAPDHQPPRCALSKTCYWNVLHFRLQFMRTITRGVPRGGAGSRRDATRAEKPKETDEGWLAGYRCERAREKRGREDDELARQQAAAASVAWQRPHSTCPTAGHHHQHTAFTHHTHTCTHTHTHTKHTCIHANILSCVYVLCRAK